MLNGESKLLRSLEPKITILVSIGQANWYFFWGPQGRLVQILKTKGIRRFKLFKV